MWLFFAFTLFLSSSLLFWLQPMVGKMLLPRLGGSPAVWNTCLVFFQVGLLAGYAYAHSCPARLGTRLHAFLHIVLLVLSLAFVTIPLSLTFSPADRAALLDLGGETPPAESAPVFWLLGVLAFHVGVPFVLVASTARLVQRWFAES